MKKYALDSNLYIRASRSSEERGRLTTFLRMYGSRTYLHAVVVQELLVGATSTTHQREVHRAYVEPFERLGRTIVPGYTAWRRSAEVITKLTERKLLSPGGFSSSFLNDVLIAVSCRDAGVTLITSNTSDFERIREVEHFAFAPPWPHLPTE